MDPAAPDSAPSSRRMSTAGLLTLVNGALAGVASVYVTTRSEMVTVVAGVTGVLLALVTLTFGR